MQNWVVVLQGCEMIRVLIKIDFCTGTTGTGVVCECLSYQSRQSENLGCTRDMLRVEKEGVGCPIQR